MTTDPSCNLKLPTLFEFRLQYEINVYDQYLTPETLVFNFKFNFFFKIL